MQHYGDATQHNGRHSMPWNKKEIADILAAGTVTTASNITTSSITTATARSKTEM